MLNHKQKAMTVFRVHIKKRAWWHMPKVLTIKGGNYFISDKDSQNVSRFVIYKNVNGGKQHVFVANFSDVDHVLLD